MNPPRPPTIVLGSGLHAIATALQIRDADPEAAIVFVDPAPRPGGLLHSRRVEGFVCELGWQALRADPELVLPLIAKLRLDAAILPASSEVPDELAAAFCAPLGTVGEVVTLRSGLEAIVQAARSVFPGAFLLGRPIVRHTDELVVLGGEVQHEIAAQRILVTPDLGARFGPSLWFGFDDPAAQRALTGPGFVVEPAAASPVRAALFSTSLWPGRALPGRSAARMLLHDIPHGRHDGAADRADASADAEAVAQEAERLLRERTGLTSRVVFRRLYTS